jgi:cell division septum initiation protein DivIVA
MNESSDNEEDDNETTYTDVSYKTLIDIVKDQKNEINSLKQTLKYLNNDVDTLESAIKWISQNKHTEINIPKNTTEWKRFLEKNQI